MTFSLSPLQLSPLHLLLRSLPLSFLLLKFSWVFIETYLMGDLVLELHQCAEASEATLIEANAKVLKLGEDLLKAQFELDARYKRESTYKVELEKLLKRLKRMKIELKKPISA